METNKIPHRTCIEYLDLVKEKHDLDTDYKLAQFLHVGRSQLSAYRLGRSTFDDFMCSKIATAVELPFELVLADIHYHRESRPEAKEFWNKYAEKISARAALALTSISLLVGLNGFGASVQAMEGLSCILC